MKPYKSKWTPALLSMILAIVLILTAWPADSQARPYTSFFRGVRPLGMGGAFTAVADDENALFYNPAGLSSISMLNVGIFNPLVEVSGDSIDLIGDLGDTDMDNVGEVTDLLRKYVGKHQHVRAALFPHVGFRLANVGAMVGGLVQAEVDADIRNPVYPEAYLDYVQDISLLAGAGVGLPLTGLRVGATLKGGQRKSLSEVYTADDIADNNFDDRFDNDMKSGNSVGLD
ncbi:MAG: hypothetical protein HKP58_20380, partial [Desulfatitalea sp.]|nr:hypothetical protein [Desulfatitalea sp.]NNK02776.1 hypothetical protein [Desulfatitalea sp.]